MPIEPLGEGRIFLLINPLFPDFIKKKYLDPKDSKTSKPGLLFYDEFW